MAENKILLTGVKLEKEYGDRQLLNIERLEISDGVRIGLIGRNGAGKSTLLKILSGELEAEKGVVKRNCGIAVIAQTGETDGEADGRYISQMQLRDSAVKSGGERTRLAIAAAFSKREPLLFADEPTTNLDLVGIERLERMMSGYRGAIVLVSHDREFLDNVCNQIWELEDGKLRIFPGNYSDFLEQKRRERTHEEFEYEQYRKEKRRIERNIIQVKEEARQMGKPPRRMGQSEWMLYKDTASIQQGHVQSRAKAMDSRLQHLEKKEKPKELPRISMKLSETDKIRARNAARIEHLSVFYDGFPVLSDVSLDIPTGKRVFLTGANGAGKSTLIRALMERGEHVSITSEAKIGYFSQGQENLREDKTVLENVVETAKAPAHICRAVLKNLYMDEGDIGKRVSVLSGGERVKTALAKLLVSDVNFLILDEPANHMDVYTMEGLEKLLSDYDGTLLAVSHDRKMVEKLADEIYEVADGMIWKQK